jgi:hypothetical protein
MADWPKLIKQKQIIQLQRNHSSNTSRLHISMWFGCAMCWLICKLNLKQQTGYLIYRLQPHKRLLQRECDNNIIMFQIIQPLLAHPCPISMHIATFEMHKKLKQYIRESYIKEAIKWMRLFYSEENLWEHCRIGNCYKHKGKIQTVFKV